MQAVCSSGPMSASKHLSRRVQFLPSLPSNDLSSWIQNASRRGSSAEPGAPSTCPEGGKPNAPGDPIGKFGVTEGKLKRKRQDMPVVEHRKRELCRRPLRLHVVLGS